MQNFAKDRQFIGAPAPRDIAEAAYGRRLDDRLRKATVERILPCIVDSQPIPNDLVIAVRARASNRSGLDWWEWENRHFDIWASAFVAARNASLSLH